MKKNPRIPNTVIAYQRLGQTCLRRKPTKVRNPRTPKQQAARRRFVERFATPKHK